MQAMINTSMVYSTPFNMYDVDMYGMHEKPNLITGEGRTKLRPYSAYKVGDLKKKERRKMAKKSKRQNRRK